jgi:hypothetical protein
MPREFYNGVWTRGVVVAGQGSTIKAVARELESSGWSVVYVCIPNTPHVGVVPITIKDGSAEQRYPDIVAYRDQITKIVEVEMGLTENVLYDIQTRFQEMVEALEDLEAWDTWRQHIHKVTGHSLPIGFEPECELVVCAPTSNAQIPDPIPLVTSRIETMVVVVPAKEYKRHVLG